MRAFPQSSPLCCVCGLPVAFTVCGSACSVSIRQSSALCSWHDLSLCTMNTLGIF